MLTPAQITAKWLANYQGSSQAMTDGSNAVQTAPGVAAAAQQAYWLSRIQASANKWATNVAAVSLADWRTAYQTLGITRGQAGAASKQGKYLKFITAYSSFLPGAVSQVKAMPKGNIQQSIARASTMIQLSYQWGLTNV